LNALLLIAFDIRVAETLRENVLKAINAPTKPMNIPIITPENLATYDAFLFGIPTRFGNFPVQWKAFWDSTGGLWAKGTLHGKYAVSNNCVLLLLNIDKDKGVFISTSTPGGGQESTALAAMSTLTHHGIIYVPLGYKTALAQLTNHTEVRGGSPWGAGTFAVSTTGSHFKIL
jgi:multimeric flavodoxin WrbA